MIQLSRMYINDADQVDMLLKLEVLYGLWAMKAKENIVRGAVVEKTN